MTSLDITIFVLFLMANIIVGIVAGKSVKNFKEYVYGNKDFLTFIVMAAIFATCVDGESLIVMSVLPATSLSYTSIIIMLCFLNVLLIGTFSGKIINVAGRDSLSSGDIIAKFYGENSKIITGIISTFMSILIIAIQLISLSLVLDFFLGLNRTLSIWVIGVLIVSYSAFGGVRSVTWSEFLKFIFTIIIIPIILVPSLVNFDSAYTANTANGVASKNFDVNFTLTEQMLGYSLSIAIPTFHPPLLQKMLMCRDGNQAKKGFTLSAFFNSIFLMIIAFASYVYYITYPTVNPQLSFLEILNSQVPYGFRGLLLCGIASIILSAADSYLNSSGISFAWDVIIPLNNKFTKDAQINMLTLTASATALVGVCSCLVAIYFDELLTLVLLANSVWGAGIGIPLLLALIFKNMSKISFYLSVVFAVSISLWNLIFAAPTLEGSKLFLSSILATVGIFFITNLLKKRGN